MIIHIVTCKNNLFHIGILLIKKPLDLMPPVDSGSLLSGVGETPPTERLGGQQDATRAIPDLLIVCLSNARVFGLKAFPCIFKKLDGLFVHTNYRTTLILRPTVYLNYILHRCHKSYAMFLRNAPTFLQVRLIFVFFRIRPTCI